MTPAAPPSAGPPIRPEYATVAGFCTLSGLGRTTVYAALRDGQIPARKVGNRTLIQVAAGLDWIDRQPAFASGQKNKA